MSTPDIFEQIAQGMSNPERIAELLKGSFPLAADGNVLNAQTGAWLGSLESLLQGAEALRHLQLDAIHRTQRRTARLAKSISGARSPADTVAALQAFAEENVQDAAQYWNAYREIMQDAEQHIMRGALAGTTENPGRQSRAGGKGQQSG